MVEKGVIYVANAPQSSKNAGYVRKRTMLCASLWQNITNHGLKDINLLHVTILKPLDNRQVLSSRSVSRQFLRSISADI
jgi:hypothetical protein